LTENWKECRCQQVVDYVLLNGMRIGIGTIVS